MSRFRSTVTCLCVVGVFFLLLLLFLFCFFFAFAFLAVSFSSSFFPSLFFSGGRGDGVGIKSCETILLPRKQLHCAHDCRLNGYSVCLFCIIKKNNSNLTSHMTK